MSFMATRWLHWMKAMLSGLSLTLTLVCGIGLMRTLMCRYDEVVPGGHACAPALAKLFMSLPHHLDSAGVAMILIMVGGTWLSAQSDESAIHLLNRCVVAFVVTGIYACSFTHRCLCGGIHWEGPDSQWTEYVWLIPAAVPLVVAWLKQRGGKLIAAKHAQL